MSINKRLIQEEAEYLIQLYKNKNNLDLYLTSGKNYCYDIYNNFNIVDDNNIDIIIKNIERYDLKFNNIYIDSNYIASQQAKLFQDPIIKIWNGKYQKDYREFRCYNYIDDLKYYIPGVKTFYLLNDDNITPELLNYDIEIIEANVTKLTKELETLLFANEVRNFKTLSWEDYLKTINKKNCFAINSLTIDVHTLDIIPCTGINQVQFIIGHIYDEGIFANHVGIATQVVGCDRCKSSSFCCQCVYAKTCELSCYYKSFIETNDPVLVSKEFCDYYKEKALFLSYVYDVIGVRKKALEMNDKELVEFIDRNK